MEIYIFRVFLVGWLIFLTWIVFSIRKHYFNLTSRTKKQRIDEILDQMLENDRNFKSKIDLIKKELEGAADKSKFYLQKIGLVRFNPFERMAGEQSFAISFLDNQNSGVIINFIYTHDGLRVYTKKVTQGKGEGHELSEEERKAIRESK